MNKIMVPVAQVAVMGAAIVGQVTLHLIGFCIGCAIIEKGSKLISKKSKRNKK